MIRNLAQLFEGLNAIYPTRYSHFKDKQEPPFICYVEGGSDDFFADNQSYVEGTLVDIELYTAQKDEKAERKIKDFLKQHELTYVKSSTVWIKEEKVFQCVFSTKLIEGEI